MNINWNPPTPRKGFVGQWDKFVGPGATSAEEWVQLICGVLLAIGSIAIFFGQQADNPSIWQLLVVLFLAVDISGGIVTNATSAAKRWYFRPSQGFKAHFGFIALHGIHIGLIAALFTNNPLVYFVLFYGYLLLAALVILRMPLYLQRPVAFAFFAGAILLNQINLAGIQGLGWFIPLLFLKLLLAHLLKEAPYQPDDA